MLAKKKTVKNEITPPETVVSRFAGVECFDVSTDGECIILRPLQPNRADEVRARLAQIGIDEQDVAVRSTGRAEVREPSHSFSQLTGRRSAGSVLRFRPPAGLPGACLALDGGRVQSRSQGGFYDLLNESF
jgi:hypothetical protein